MENAADVGGAVCASGDVGAALGGDYARTVLYGFRGFVAGDPGEPVGAPVWAFV